MSDYWSDENKIPGRDVEHVSPCGRYQLTISEHKTGEGCWHYTSATLRLNAPREEGEEDRNYNYRTRIAFLKRNYSHFPFCWFPQGDEMLLFYGEDYQGYGCVKCSTGERVQYLPPGKRHGFGFCWISIDPDPESPAHLLVEGCVWGGPYERYRYDVSNPLALPYPNEYLGLADEEEDEDDEDAESEPAAEAAS